MNQTAHSPCSIFFILHYLLQHFFRTQSVLFHNSNVLFITSIHVSDTIHAHDVWKRPSIIKRLDCEYWYFDMLVDVLSEHAIVFLVFELFDALWDWWVNIRIRQHHQIDELISKLRSMAVFIL